MAQELSYVAFARLPTGRAHGYAIMKMCEQFAAAGVHVLLYVPRRTNELAGDPFEYYGVQRIFDLRTIFATDFLSTHEYSRVPFVVDQAVFLASLALRSFDTVYTRDYQVALVVRAHSIVLEVHTIPHRTALFRRALSRADKIVVISQGLKKDLQALGVPDQKMLVAHDAVDLAEFAESSSRGIWSEYSVDARKKIALYTGHFYGWKGAETLGNAARELKGGVEVVLMGGVDQELKDFADMYKEDRNVHVIGFQPRERIPKLLMSADALVLPNSAIPKISSHYTSPLKLFQYMASGVPIVASDLPSIREILSDDTAFWFTADNETSLARTIEHVLSHPDEAKQKAQRALEEVKKYTWAARARTILSFID